MNRLQHEDVSRVAASLAGAPDDLAEALAAGSSAPDYLQDVTCRVLGSETEFSKLGHLTSLQHSQRPGNRGYCWRDDPSMGVAGEAGEILMPATHATVLGTSMPMLRAMRSQPGATLDRFVFPSAADCAAFYQQAAGDSPDIQGMALHMVEDTCIPHHGWGVCWWGHQEFEDGCEALWFDHRKRLKLSGSDKPFTDAVRADTIEGDSLQEICEANAAWTRRWFGEPRNMPECLGKDMLAVCVRAVAATMKAIQLMTKGAQ